MEVAEEMSLEALKNLENRFESICSREVAALDRVNAALMAGAYEYFLGNGFVWVETPMLTRVTGSCENVDTLYSVQHFGTQAYLPQTGQLYLEAKIPLHDKVWTVMTSSRAEPCTDHRHLNQFSLVEFERRGDFSVLLPTIEGVVKSMVSSAVKKCGDELNSFNSSAKECLKGGFARMTYEKAVGKLGLEWGDDFKHEHELALVNEAGRPLFITHYPQEIKFFNMRLNREDDRVVNSADLIMPFSGESAGSAEREDDYDILVKRLKQSRMFSILSQRGVSINEFNDYLNLVRNHRLLHCGAGIGFNRVSQSVLGLESIRQATNYPVTAQSLY
nr:asparagine--tRNA ligase [uncultured archaeon]